MYMNIIVFGGYGNFGRRICESLAQLDDVRLVIAGRNLQKAKSLSDRLNRSANCESTYAELDGSDKDLSIQLRDLHIELVINASGPFQGQDYSIAKACIDAGINYLDLADSRDFVSGIRQLDEPAKQAGVSIITGVSTVPALSSVVVESFLKEFAALEEYYAGITPGYQTERGDATTAGILSYVGKPIQIMNSGKRKTVTALQGLHAYDYGNIFGRRLLGYVDVPDLELFPQRFSDLRDVRFYSGLEIRFMHLLLWCMTWLCRWNIVKNWARLAKPIIRISHLFDRMGTPDGGMFIELRGKDNNNNQKEIVWHLYAFDGDGPYVPTIPVIVLVKKLLNGEAFLKGAYPCLAMFSLDEFFDVASNWKIEQRVTIR